MARVFYVHWNRDEALGHVRALRAAGHSVRYHHDPRAKARLAPLPDVLVISLDRLPSHGRAVAEWWVESKQRRAKPLVFVGGQPDQVAIVRSKLPGGRFCARGQLEQTIARLCRAAPDR